MANPLAQAALDGLRIGREEAQQANRSQQAKDWYENWKKTNGIPKDSNTLPPVDATPTWARPYLFPRADASPQSDLQIANAPRFIKGSAPANVIWKAPHLDSPYIDKQIERGWRPLTPPGPKGPQLFPLSQVTPGPAPVWPSHKWPYPTPGQGPLPNPNIPDKGLTIAGVDYNKNMPQNYRDWSEFHRKNYEEKETGWLDRMIKHTQNYPG